MESTPTPTPRGCAYMYPYEWHAANGDLKELPLPLIEDGGLVMMILAVALNQLGMQSGWEKGSK